jgi:hypothetical protein
MHACRRHLTPPFFPALPVSAVLTLSCGGSPSSSTPVTTIPKASPKPTPVTDIGAAFKDASCALGKGSLTAECRRKSSALAADMDKAMDQLVQQMPHVFDLNAEYEKGTHAYKVLDKEAYMNGLVANLHASGLCAERDADDALQQTIRVKDSPDFSEDRRPPLERLHAARVRGIPPDLHPRGLPRRPCRGRPSDRQRMRPALPPAGLAFQLQGPSQEQAVLHARLDAARGAGRGYCASVGMPERAICPIRIPGTPDRVACENY